MIFLTVGTTDFDPLVRRMDLLAEALEEEVVAQIGRGAYVPTHMQHFRFAPSLDPYLDRARLVVGHGGLGTAVEVLERGLPLVALSNPDRFDLHQDDLLRALEDRTHLLWCRDVDELPEALERVESMSFAPYETPQCRAAELVRRHLGLPQNQQ